jgi:hypothetical protein
MSFTLANFRNNILGRTQTEIESRYLFELEIEKRGHHLSHCDLDYPLIWCSRCGKYGGIVWEEFKLGIRYLWYGPIINNDCDSLLP